MHGIAVGTRRRSLGREGKSKCCQNASELTCRQDKMKKFVLSVLFLSMCLPVMVWAESPWVLWSERSGYGNPPTTATELQAKWEVLNAFPDRQSCLKEASNYIKFLEEYEKNRKGVTIKKQKHAARTKVFMEYDKHTSIVSPACLPAIVDPRPKFRE